MKETISIKENRDFRRLYHRGKSAVTGHLVIYCSKNRLGNNRLGLTVGTKLGGAVTRNRVKRLMREAYRLNEQKIKKGYDIVIVARGRACSAKYHAVEKAFLKAAKSLNLMNEE